MCWRLDKRELLSFFLLSLLVYSSAQDNITREQYIETYAELSMKEMALTGIPASITLAQGCLESSNGNSRLALDAKNHFGIKCHDWTGKKIYHDDDEKDECFRKYRSVEDSFTDHSEFLTSKSRYEALFLLKPYDYKAWAKGLKKAGYATSNKYADLLIDIIEENELFDYDQLVLEGEQGKERPTISVKPKAGREVLLSNRIEYIIVQAGDSPTSLREEMQLYPGEIYRYNDIGKDFHLDPGMQLYLQPKRWKAEKGNEVHVLSENETMWDVSQFYGIKLKRLYRMNSIAEGDEIEAGTTLWLRKRKPIERKAKVALSKPPEEDVQMEMEFDEF